MADKRNSIQQILKVTLILCLFCSIVVSLAAIGLREKQEDNKLIERNANMLAAAGLLDMAQPGAKDRVPELMKNVTAKVIDLDTGDFDNSVDPQAYDQREAAKDSARSKALTKRQDPASIKRREYLGKVFFILQNNQIDTVIVPIRGYGLWSTLYGFIALENDGNTIRGLGFYEHGETPGLGGEVDNPKWKNQWKNKKLLADDGSLAISVVKNLNSADPGFVNKVDGIAGASLTSRGVDNLIRYWLGDLGYGLFLNKLRNDEVQL